MPKKSVLELPGDFDVKTRKKLEAYHKKIKNAEVSVDQVSDSYGLPKIRISFESHNKKTRGFMEVTHYYAN
jgi:hypothetical protein